MKFNFNTYHINSITFYTLCVDWYPKDESTARAILVYNQAAVMASSGDLQTAGDILRVTVFIQFIILLLYVSCLMFSQQLFLIFKTDVYIQKWRTSPSS